MTAPALLGEVQIVLKVVTGCNAARLPVPVAIPRCNWSGSSHGALLRIGMEVFLGQTGSFGASATLAATPSRGATGRRRSLLVVTLTLAFQGT